MEKYLQQLVARRTVTSDQQANQDALDYLEDFFAEHGLYCVRRTFAGYGTLVATTKKNNKTPRVLLSAHIDVVPGPDEVFSSEERDGKYLGRGVFDMKFAIASYMEVLDSLGDNVADYDLGIMITCDEEIGGTEGVRRLVDLGYKPGVCILPDGAADWQLETFAKGVIHGKVTVTGTSSHGSKPWEGDSATFKLVDLLHELKQHFADQTLNTNTLNIGLISGGKALNQTPDSAEASLDIRYIALSDRKNIIAVLAGLCQKYQATFAELVLYGYPCINNLDDPMIQPFVESVHTVTGYKATGTVSTGGSDARFFTPIAVPCIICRPAGGNQHANEEWIDKAGALQYTDVIIDYLNKIAK
jgi:acetylornithine deacetylase/succinyl-diaminopimelate desuccinylase-like protein